MQIKIKTALKTYPLITLLARLCLIYVLIVCTTLTLGQLRIHL